MTDKYISCSVSETIKIAENFAKTLRSGDVIFLNGELGAGKTHFAKGVARSLGIFDNITSPSFAIVNEYISESTKLFHFDLYRLGNFDDLDTIGFYDYVKRGGVCIIEWGESFGLEKEFKRVFSVNIKIIGEDAREIETEGII